MLCWSCNAELILGGDHDAEDEEYLIITNLHCPQWEEEQ